MAKMVNFMLCEFYYNLNKNTVTVKFSAVPSLRLFWNPRIYTSRIWSKDHSISAATLADVACVVPMKARANSYTPSSLSTRVVSPGPSHFGQPLAAPHLEHFM